MYKPLPPDIIIQPMGYTWAAHELDPLMDMVHDQNWYMFVEKLAVASECKHPFTIWHNTTSNDIEVKANVVIPHFKDVMFVIYRNVSNRLTPGQISFDVWYDLMRELGTMIQNEVGRTIGHSHEMSGNLAPKSMISKCVNCKPSSRWYDTAVCDLSVHFLGANSAFTGNIFPAMTPVSQMIDVDVLVPAMDQPSTSGIMNAAPMHEYTYQDFRGYQLRKLGAHVSEGVAFLQWLRDKGWLTPYSVSHVDQITWWKLDQRLGSYGIGFRTETDQMDVSTFRTPNQYVAGLSHVYLDVNIPMVPASIMYQYVFELPGADIRFKKLDDDYPLIGIPKTLLKITPNVHVPEARPLTPSITPPRRNEVRKKVKR